MHTSLQLLFPMIALPYTITIMHFYLFLIGMMNHVLCWTWRMHSMWETLTEHKFLFPVEISSSVSILYTIILTKTAHWHSKNIQRLLYSGLSVSWVVEIVLLIIAGDLLCVKMQHKKKLNWELDDLLLTFCDIFWWIIQFW